MAGADDIDAVLAKLRAPIVADLAKKFPNLTGQQRDALAHWGMRAADEAAGDRKMSKGQQAAFAITAAESAATDPVKVAHIVTAETTPFCQKDGTLYVLEGAKSSESTSVIVAGFAGDPLPRAALNARACTIEDVHLSTMSTPMPGGPRQR